MGSAADALLAAAQPAGAGSWDLENKVGLSVAFGQDAGKAPMVWLDLLLPQARPCTWSHVSESAVLKCICAIMQAGLHHQRSATVRISLLLRIAPLTMPSACAVE